MVVVAVAVAVAGCEERGAGPSERRELDERWMAPPLALALSELLH